MDPLLTPWVEYPDPVTLSRTGATLPPGWKAVEA